MFIQCGFIRVETASRRLNTDPVLRRRLNTGRPILGSVTRGRAARTAPAGLGARTAWLHVIDSNALRYFG